MYGIDDDDDEMHVCVQYTLCYIYYVYLYGMMTLSSVVVLYGCVDPCWIKGYMGMYNNSLRKGRS